VALDSHMVHEEIITLSCHQEPEGGPPAGSTGFFFLKDFHPVILGSQVVSTAQLQSDPCYFPSPAPPPGVCRILIVLEPSHGLHREGKGLMSSNHCW
jgi:hypothetical protein